MDGEIDGLTDDYIGRADKSSVILYTREMKRREEERKKERLEEDFIINITNSFPWRVMAVTESECEHEMGRGSVCKWAYVF